MVIVGEYNAARTGERCGERAEGGNLPTAGAEVGYAIGHLIGGFVLGNVKVYFTGRARVEVDALLTAEAPQKCRGDKVFEQR